MSFLSWLRNLSILPNRHQARNSRRGGSKRSTPRCRLTLESLEDRTVPSTLPGLGFSTYLGNYDYANAIAVDSVGNSYVTGEASIGAMPILNATQPHNFGSSGDAFVAKFDPAGSLVYCTYLGGTGSDDGLGIAADSAGNAYITGLTTSTDFPTLNAFQQHNAGGRDAFFTKLDPTGALLYSTYLGGSGTENLQNGLLYTGRIAVDSAGNAYLSGSTTSTDFPTSSNAVQPTYTTGSIFVTKLNTNLAGANSLVYSTYLSGGESHGLAVDSSGAVYVAGNNIVTRLNPEGSAVVYSTQVTGTTILGIAVDAAGNAYVTGNVSANIGGLPTTPNAYQTAPGRGLDAFVTELDATGARVIYSTYLSGSSNESSGRGIALDAGGHIFVTGEATPGFPTKNAFQGLDDDSLTDAFVAELDPSQSGDASLVYSSYLGGSSSDYGCGIGVDGSGDAFITGKTNSYDFPTLNAIQTTNAQGEAAFAAKLLPAASMNPTSTTLNSSATSSAPGQNVTFTATVTSSPGAGTPSGSVTFLDGQTMLGTMSLDAGGQARFSTSTLTAGSHTVEAVYFESANFSASISPSVVQVVSGSQASITTLKSSANPSVYSQAVTLTATVKATSGTMVPTGAITFMDGSTVLGTGSLNNSGVATFSNSSLSVGSHALTAVYGGDSTFAANTSPTLNQTVKQASTKTTLVTSLASSPFGQPVTFTATVNPVTPGSGTPTGTVTFMDGNTILATVTLVNGKATFTTSTLTKGKHTISAIYNGDVDFTASTSASLIETIQ